MMRERDYDRSYLACSACSFEPCRANTDPQYEAMLRDEREASRYATRSAYELTRDGQKRAMLTALDERNLRALVEGTG